MPLDLFAFSCVWQFWVAAKRDVVLTCNRFKLGGIRHEGNCEGDKLAVVDTSDNPVDVAYGRNKVNSMTLR